MLFSLNRINIYRLTKEWDYCNNFGMSSKQAGKGDSNFRRTLKKKCVRIGGRCCWKHCSGIASEKTKNNITKYANCNCNCTKIKSSSSTKIKHGIPRIQRKLATLWPNSTPITVQRISVERTRREEDGVKVESRRNCGFSAARSMCWRDCCSSMTRNEGRRSYLRKRRSYNSQPQYCHVG